MASSLAVALVLSGVLRISWSGPEMPVTLAVNDLAADCAAVLGAEAEIIREGPADITLAIDKTLTAPEAWEIDISAEGVRIRGSDSLGLVHGIYQFSERCLGVDPLGFWKNIPPERRTRIELRAQAFASVTPKFRYRGWFINDEDLLTEFGKSAGPRHIDYPFYAQVIDPAMAERIYEALLRLGGNMIIPASFVDVMNPPEAELVRRAVARGLYVTQHHVEPMGVSHFGFENYWKARGEKKAFRYSTEPDAVRTVWRAHAQKWWELAGEQVIWQLGMRGRGDRPIWIDDPNIDSTTGGEFISKAMADQAAIVRSIDSRAKPLMTTTLFLEGAELMAAGKLRFPVGTTVVFADKGATQEMQRDFEIAPRLPDYRYGVYFHAAFWRRGPHLVQGVAPQRIYDALGQLEARGDTAYAIINVSNVREHVLGAHVFIRTALHGTERPLAATLAEFAPAATQPFQTAFYKALVKSVDGVWLQDGDLVDVAAKFLQAKTREEALTTVRNIIDPEETERAAEQFERVALAADLKAVPERWRAWTDEYYVIQAKYMAALYRCAAALARDEPEVAARHIERSLEIRSALATGPWTGWYTGDKKANWPTILSRLRALAAKEPLAVALHSTAGSFNP